MFFSHSTRIVVPVSDFVEHLKMNTLLHVHHDIDLRTERFLRHGCPRVYMEEIRGIPEVSHTSIVDYICYNADTLRRDDGRVTEFATVYENERDHTAP